MKFLLCIILILSLNTLAEAPSKKIRGFFIFMPKEKSVPRINHEIHRITDLSLLHPLFRNKVIEMIHECSIKGINLVIVETYRHPIRQNYLRSRGSTMLRGGRSKHQYNIAIDVVPVKFGAYIWHDQELWDKIGRIGEKQGLIWGGRWRRFKDNPHFEMPISINDIHTLHIPDTILIPMNYE